MRACFQQMINTLVILYILLLSLLYKPMVLTKRAFLLEVADGLLVVCAVIAGVEVCCIAVDIETADCGMIGVVALKSAKRRSRSATASAGLDVVDAVGKAEDVVEVDDVASDFGFDIIMLNCDLNKEIFPVNCCRNK